MQSSHFLNSHCIGEYEVELLDSASMLPSQIWNELVDNQFYAKKEHLEIIEEVHHNQLEFYYLLVKKDGEYLAALYFQHVIFSMSNAVNNWKTKNEGKCAVIYPFLYLAKGKQLPLLQSGNVFFTEDDGLYFKDNLSEKDKTEILNSVTRLLVQVLPKGKDTYIMFSGFESSLEGSNTQLEGFHELETEPNLILNIKPFWIKFEDYVANMSSKYRQRVNKVFKNTSTVQIQSLELCDLLQMEEELLLLYRNVANHAAFNMAHLSKGYLSSMKQMYGANFEVKVFYLEEKLVGFSSAFYTDTQQNVHFIGLDYSVNEQIPLYHRMLFEFVKESIQLSHGKIYLGRTATEIKTTIGAEPVEMVNYIRVERAWYKCVLPKVLNRFGAKPYIVRSPFKTLESIPA